MSKRLLGIGAAALTVGMLMFGIAQTASGTTAYAGSSGDDVCVTFTPTRTNTRTPTGTPPTATNTAAPTNTPVPATNTPAPTNTLAPLTFNDAPGDNISAFGNETPQRTCVATQTNTPTITNTPPPGSTSTTAPAVTNTPTGGTQGGGVQPPNTGFGDTGSEGSSLWFLLAGAALVATGSGAIVAGARRRN